MIATRVRRAFSSSRAVIYAAFVDGSVFRLTRATSIHSDVRVGGSFELLFEGRGAVRGEFLELSQNDRVRLSWNVSGFGRPDEMTVVDVTISEGHGQCVVDIEHRDLGSHESASAKTSAWQSILADLELHLSLSKGAKSEARDGADDEPDAPQARNVEG
jgi:uncharacterized protein YndB with AHSA1/START domain